METFSTLREQIHLLDDSSLEALRDLFQRAYEGFGFYRRIFDRQGLDPSDDPVEILDRFPVLDAEGYLNLQQDIFGRLRGENFLTEYTSGTTGKRKLRFTTMRDEMAEQELCVRFFRQCGIGPTDRVVALDIDSPDIYLFYARAMAELGVSDFAFYSLPADFDKSLEPAFQGEPTVIISVPSVLVRCYPKLKTLASQSNALALRKIIYIGETMSPSFRETLTNELGVELFSFFGSTEIGSVGGECMHHNGVHLYNDKVIPTIIDPAEKDGIICGEVVWTTLHFQDQPLIKYATRDLVSIRTEPCPCSCPYPLMDSVSRTEEQFVIYGYKFRYEVFHEALQKRFGPLELLFIEVDFADGKDRVKFVLPEHLAACKSAVVETIQQTDDMRYFLGAKFLDVDLEFASSRTMVARKSRRVLDRRSGCACRSGE